MSLPLLEPDLLRTFVLIADSGSFSRAAEQVHRTPGAVSMQVKRLEKTLERELFVRGPRHAHLTKDGEALLAPARRLLELNEAAVAQFLAPSFEGVVRIGVHDDIGRMLLPDVIQRFARTHPCVQLDVLSGRSEGMIARLDAGEIDLALITAGEDHRSVDRGEEIHREELVWAGIENGASSAARPLPLALAAAGCSWRYMALEALDEAGIPHRIAYSTEHTAGQETAALADLAIAAMPASLLRPPLVRLDEKAGMPPLGTFKLVLIVKQDPEPAVAALAQRVRERFAVGQARE